MPRKEKQSTEAAVREIRRRARRKFAAEERWQMAEKIPESVQRWTSKRRTALVLEILKAAVKRHPLASRTSEE
jgi:hypothetical protein